MTTSRDVIPGSRRRCAWLTGKLMWGFFYRVPGGKAALDAVLRRVYRDEHRQCESLGQRLWVNPLASIVELRLATCGVYEPDVVDYLQSVLTEGMTVVDIGANIGFFSLLASDLVGASGRVVSFEPTPPTYAHLLRNLELNGRRNVLTSPNALSDRAGHARMTTSDDNALSALATEPGAGGVEVATETLDAALERLGVTVCHVIKMDIEGAEWMALRGMRATLRSNPGVVLVIEVHPRAIAEFGGSSEAFAKDLADAGFNLFWLDERARLRPVPRDRWNDLSGHVVCRRATA